MSQALAVEKTSKRGGRIVHEDDFKKPLPNMFGESFKTPQLIADEYNDEIDAEAEGGQPDQPGGGGGQEVDEYGNSLAPPSMMPPPPPGPIGAAAPKPEEAKPSITDLMKNPSKVVLCKVRYNFFINALEQPFFGHSLKPQDEKNSELRIFCPKLKIPAIFFKRFVIYNIFI